MGVQFSRQEKFSYRVIGSTPSGQEPGQEPSQEIETIYSNDDYSFWSRYRVTPTGIQPLWQRNVGPGQMFAAIPLAIITCWLLFFVLRRLLPRVLSGVVAMTSRLAAALFAEIAANLQKFMPHRNRPRPVRPKPHKAHAYKPCL